MGLTEPMVQVPDLQDAKTTEDLGLTIDAQVVLQIMYWWTHVLSIKKQGRLLPWSHRGKIQVIWWNTVLIVLVSEQRDLEDPSSECRLCWGWCSSPVKRNAERSFPQSLGGSI